MRISAISPLFALGLLFLLNVSKAADLERVWIEITPGSIGPARAEIASVGGTVHHEFGDLNAIAASVPSTALTALQRNPNVTGIEADPQRELIAQSVPYGIDSVGAREVWDAGGDGVVDTSAPTGAGRMVCVIDSGVDRNHEDLSGLNFTGGHPAGWDSDGCGHGTHVVGTLAAQNNALGVVGVSPGATSFYIVKVFGDFCGWTYSSDLVDAANRCRDAGADVISMSLGGGIKSRNEQRAFQSIYNDGLLPVAAAGNGGNGAKSYPASYPSVMSVAAVDSNNEHASFSQTNSAVEIAAPGVSVLSTVPTGGSTLSDPANLYEYWNGTSMATPHVSGVAALVWSSDTSKTNSEIREALTATALDLGEVGKDNATGYGLVQAPAAWVYLGGNGGGNAAPVASFTSNCVDLTCTFDGSGSNDPDGSIVGYSWEFGDGSTETGALATYTFATAADYTVVLTVTDDQGATGTRSEIISVGDSGEGEDTTPPVISAVSSTKLGGTRFKITWITDEDADSAIIFDCCGEFTDPSLTTNHSMNFRGSKNTTYTYRVRSTDAAGNTSIAGPFVHNN